MYIISWNVNGIRAALKKGMAAFIAHEQPDIICLQETKARSEQVDLPFEFKNYRQFWNSAEKPGYSGTAIFSKIPPISVTYDMNIDEHDQEGRVITAEYTEFILITVYTPNSKDELLRLPYRMKWDFDFLTYVKNVELEKNKPIIICGDLNVSHQEIDLERPRENRRSPGFSDEERKGFSNFIEAQFIDTYRHFNPEQKGAYSWWSYRAGARQNNVGWRLDYFLISNNLISCLIKADILAHVHGSDHCPVSLMLN
jgi:exodeoxyribonuclease III